MFRSSFLALAFALKYLCMIMSSFWDKIDRMVTTQETRSANNNFDNFSNEN